MRRDFMGELKEIREIKENKKQYLDLLLLADEQENMIDRYLERGTMYVSKTLPLHPTVRDADTEEG